MAIFVLLFLLGPLAALAAPASKTPIKVPLHSSRLIHLKYGVSQITVSDSKTVTARILPDSQLLITAGALGQCRITVWSKENKPFHYQVVVEIPVEELAAKFQVLLPGELIHIEAVGNTVALTGQVSEAIVSEQAQKLAEAHLKGMGQEASVLNFLAIRGNQQVQLRVKIAEVSRTALRQVGINFWHRNEHQAGGMLGPGTRLDSNLAPDLGTSGAPLQVGGTLTPGAGTAAPIPLITPPFTTDAFGLLFATQANAAFPLSIAVNLLQAQGLAKILSEPTLVAYSGQVAKFLAGGEFPIPIPQALGQTAIEFKKFGVQLTFTPTVMASGTVHLNVSVSVSDKDQSGAIQIQGTSVPGLSTRLSETTVRLKDGQSFAIAGLLQDRMESTTSKVPILGDLPILGMFFRKSAFRRSESELVILVTANLVQPLKPGEVPPLPGEDEMSDPGSIAFFLLGTTDAASPKDIRRGPAGPVGFSQ